MKLRDVWGSLSSGGVCYLAPVPLKIPNYIKNLALICETLRNVSTRVSFTVFITVKRLKNALRPYSPPDQVGGGGATLIL